MATNHIQPGQTVAWQNDTGSPVASGQAVLVGALLVVALGTIGVDESGEVATEEVWRLPKAEALDIGFGDQVYWDAVDGEVNLDSANPPCGKAVEDAAAGDAVVGIKINV